MAFTAEDHLYMTRALQLAEQGLYTAPEERSGNLDRIGIGPPDMR